MGLNMPESKLRTMLDECLLTDTEMELRVEAWLAFSDPIPKWQAFQMSEIPTENEHQLTHLLPEDSPRLPWTKIYKYSIAYLMHMRYDCKKARRSALHASQFRSASHKESLVNNTRADLLTRLMIFALLAVATSVNGCQTADFASVQGVVTLDGKPLADIEVQFLPVPNQRTNHPSTSVYTDADGKYSIVASGDYGVLIGIHHVCLNDAMVMMPTSNAGQEDGTLASEGIARTVKRKSRVPAIYSDSLGTPFKNIEINSQSVTQDFALVSNLKGTTNNP